MNCQEFRDSVVEHLEGTLAPDQAAACQAHLHECAACRAFAEECHDLGKVMQADGARSRGVSLLGPVMTRIREREAETRTQETERSTFMSRLLKWRWSLGFSAAASVAILVLATVFVTPNVELAAAEIIARGAAAVANLRSIHLVGLLRADPVDNFSAISPTHEPVKIEMWKQFGAPPRWRIEKAGRVAVVDGSSTMLLIRPDHAAKYPGAAQSAFDTGWLHQVADVNRALNAELAAIKRNGWATAVASATGADGREQSVVTVTARSGYRDDDYLKNAFFCTADTQRIYTFDKATGLLVSARVMLLGQASATLLFELTQIECNPTLASDVFTLTLPDGVSWREGMQVLPDNAKYVAMTPETAAKAFFDACSRQDWAEAGKFTHVTATLKQYYGGIQVISLGKSFTSMISLINGAQFVPYEIKMPDGTVKKHNIALKRDPKTQRWFVDGGI